MTYDAILFDFDGVLADSEPLHCQCWKEALSKFRIDLDWEIWEKECVGVADRDMMKFLALRCHPPADPNDLWQQYPHKQALYRALVAKKSPIPAEVIALMPELDGIPKAVVSSSLRPEVEPLLVAAGIRPFFATLITGGDVERHKPAPDPYLLAASLLTAHNPLVVEDSRFGIASAEAARFPWLQVPNAREMPGLLRQKLHAAPPPKVCARSNHDEAHLEPGNLAHLLPEVPGLPSGRSPGHVPGNL
jgi:beta-phosphoglucomutase